MSTADFLGERFTRLLRWERRKHREQLLIRAVLYSLVAALILLPFYGLLPSRGYRWFVPLPFLALLAPLLLFRGRWGVRDSVRALVAVDKSLGLKERALTAWELIVRKDHRTPALLVLNQAAERLKAFDPRAQFPRRCDRHSYATMAVLAVWLCLVWFDFTARDDRNVQAPAVQTLAHRLREYSRQLQEKAGDEGLRESLQAARELEKAAQKGIDGQTSDEQFREELTALSAKVEAMGKAAAREPSFATAESRQTLRDLKAELEAAQAMLDVPDGIKGSTESDGSWFERLAALPQLKRRFDQQDSQGSGGSRAEMKSFLDAMDKQVSGELDRRTLLEAQKYLEQMARREGGEAADNQMAMPAGEGDDEPAGDGEKVRSSSRIPGSEPGMKEEAAKPGPRIAAGAATQLKGLLGEGDSSGIVLKGKPSADSPRVSQDDVIAEYRRQAEQDLNSERVPEALKETVRKYFLSLQAKGAQ